MYSPKEEAALFGFFLKSQGHRFLRRWYKQLRDGKVCLCRWNRDIDWRVCDTQVRSANGKPKTLARIADSTIDQLDLMDCLTDDMALNPDRIPQMEILFGDAKVAPADDPTTR